MKDKVRVAMIGAGALANAQYYPSLAEMPDVEVAGICDLAPDKLNATADKFKIERRYADYRKMLEETAPDAVFALMPPHQVFDVAAHCLRAGRHLFIEKPPGVTAYQTRSLAKWAEKHGVIGMAGFQRRYCPIITHVKKRVAEAGPVHTVVAKFVKYNPGADESYYAGAIDILSCDAVRVVDLLRALCGGEAVNVASSVRSIATSYPNVFLAIITFSSGATGVLHANWATGRRFINAEMHAMGAYGFADPDEGGALYFKGEPKGERLDPRAIAGSDQPWHVQGFAAQARCFVDCVKTGRQPANNFSDAVKTMKLVERIYHSNIS
jgi:virulence factor